MKSRISTTRSWSAAVCLWKRDCTTSLWPDSEIITLSNTDSVSYMLGTWNLRQIPRLKILCGASPVMSRFSKRIFPLVGL